jgi:hypothetical protein
MPPLRIYVEQVYLTTHLGQQEGVRSLTTPIIQYPLIAPDGLKNLRDKITGTDTVGKVQPIAKSAS